MPKFVKYSLIAVAVVFSLLLIIVGIVAATFNPNDYKPLVIKLVQEKKQRTLAIPGDIKLTFFPKIGADLGKVVISERSSDADFASIASARVSLALLPLLSKQLVVDRIIIDGLSANVVRNKDGSTNFDDLLSEEKSEPSGQIQFEIDSVNISNSSFTFDDRQQGRKTEVSKINLDTGRIANGASSKFGLTALIQNSQPQAAVALDIESGFMFDTEKQYYQLKDLDASVSGTLLGYTDVVLKAAGDAAVQPASKQLSVNGLALSASAKQDGQSYQASLALPQLEVTDSKVSGGKLSGEAKLVEAARSISAEFSMPSFAGTPQQFTLPELQATLQLKAADTDVRGTLSAALVGDIDKLLFTSKKLQLALDGKQADAQLKLSANGQASLNLSQQTASVNLKGKLDQSSFDVDANLLKFSPLASRFTLNVDQIDLDRYQKKSAESAAGSNAKGGVEQPIDLSALQQLDTKGSIKIGALKVENIKATNVRTELQAKGGKLTLDPLAANLYGGSASGALSAQATTPPRFGVRQKLSSIDVGALLKDALGKQPIDGSGDVHLDVNASGALLSQMKKSLGGNARIALRDGAVHGINIAKTIRDAKAKIGVVRGGEAPQAGTSSTAEKSDFSELSASFQIANGVAHNEDLSAKSPLIRLTGSGDINLAAESLDYLAKATVVSTLQGQGGPELDALKGVTIPVKLSGPFTAIGWKVDFSAMVADLAKQKIDEKKEEVKDKAKEKVKESLSKGLKGLFGK